MKKNNIYPIIVTILFCAFLGILTLGSIFLPKKAFSDTENRYLAKFPEFSWEKLKSGEFGREYEEYLSDQFPFRNSWIGLKTEAELARLNKEINKVFIGNDDFLIEALYNEDIDRELYNKNIDRLVVFAREQADRLGKEHIKIMLVPQAAEILKSELPKYAAPFNQEEVLKLLSEKGLSEMLLPVRDAFLERDDKNQLYYKTDHHWTSYGAYRAYETYADSIGIEAFSLESFDRNIVNKDFLGTIHSKLNVPVEADEIEQFVPHNKPDWEVYYDGQDKRFNELYNYSVLDTKDKYRFFLDGNHGLTKIVNPSVNNGKKLIIIKDSFAHCFAPFAALHFEETWMIDLRYFNGKIGQYIEEEGFTDILLLYNIPGFIKDRNISKLTWK
ncbi:MAG: DHHW family protein [Eubacteriales bacterium]|nr:DHHW family protein [Eubacteriales bacterium]